MFLAKNAMMNFDSMLSNLASGNLISFRMKQDKKLMLKFCPCPYVFYLYGHLCNQA